MIAVWVFGVVAGLVLLAAVVGSRMPKTHVAASRAAFNAPPETVWSLIFDVSSHPNWRPGIQQVEVGPNIDGAPTWFEICAKGVRVQFARVESDPPRRMVTRLIGKNLPLYGSWTYELASEGDRTVLTITEADCIYSPLFRFFTRFVISYYGTMDVFLISLARALGEAVEPEHLNLKLDENPDPAAWGDPQL